MSNRLALLVHGDPKIGKTTLIESAPGPRLIIDTEGGARYLSKPAVQWVNFADPPPTMPDITDYSVVAHVETWAESTTITQWLKSGKHPFNTVALDTVDSWQNTCAQSVTATGQQKWGELLDRTDPEMRTLSRLPLHKTNPVWCVIVVGHTIEGNDGIRRAWLRGQLQKSVPGMFDVIGYMRPAVFADGSVGRELVIDAIPGIEAGDRTKVLTRTFGKTIPVHLDPATGHIVSGGVVDMLRVLNP